ncbi:aspartate aminotransferase [Galdieria sulphuraria]|uniref:Aspartate aminotransferase n=1 Tax=Galdieria sulphuraria TaxID=130081 RepID=M2XYM1_GALSU|nr:aspartate aminotransferase [Galdieria sulphuraria]EME28574.1 aspartate aminotransferase [Galdieria sulphuraria]|eukprot:XP_005705094.1 aspartate aminotransferase [Galdieria sulphuraria]
MERWTTRPCKEKVGFCYSSPSVWVAYSCGHLQGVSKRCKEKWFRHNCWKQCKVYYSSKMTLADSEVEAIPFNFVFPSRLNGFESEGAYSVMIAASELERKTGKKVIRLEIGQPSEPTPKHIVEAACKSLQAGETGYTLPLGLRALREEIARHVTETRGVAVLPEEVVVGPGAKPGLFFTALSILHPGEEVIYPDPGFPTYKAMAIIAEAKPVPVPMRADGKSFDMQALEKAVSSKTKMLILNSPNNPTGGVMPTEDILHIAKLAKQHNFYVIADEIYSRLVYSDEKPPSIFSLPGMKERTILIDGFSKAYSMTGFRLGWAIMPELLTKKMEPLLVHAVGCTPPFVQAAGLAALRGSQDSVQEMAKEYEKRRDLVVKELNSIPGVWCPVPEGAFYAFPDVSSFGMTSKQIANILLEKGMVAVLPGTDFGANGEGRIRISYVAPMDMLKEGLKRIRETLATLSTMNNNGIA